MNDEFSKPSELQTLLRYAEQFLGQARGGIEIVEFRGYVTNLTVDISTLNDLESRAYIQAALGEVKRCDYAVKNSPEMENKFVVPAIEKLVSAIRDRVRLEPKKFG